MATTVLCANTDCEDRTLEDRVDPWPVSEAQLEQVVKHVASQRRWQVISTSPPERRGPHELHGKNEADEDVTVWRWQLATTVEYQVMS